ncbi:MAG: hypothetical protein ABIO57_01750 [Candidatus Paceibacterota bacterium]
MAINKKYRTPVVPGYFTNLSSIENLAVLQDGPVDSEQAELVLYFNDLYQVFIHRFSHFAFADTISKEEEAQLMAMLTELIKVKHSIRQEPA